MAKPIEMAKDERYCTWYKCVDCKVTSITRLANYCPNCGVKLDWEDNNEKLEKEQIPGF